MVRYLVALFVLGFVSGEPEYHRVEVHYETVTISEDLMIDKEENYALITVGHVGDGPVVPTVNLHDFNSGFSAFKSIEEGKCTIGPVASTMEEVLQKLSNRAEGRPVDDIKILTWDCSSTSEPSENIERWAGHRVANFCKSYQSFLVTPATAKDKGKSRVRMRRSLSKIYGCWICGSRCG